MPLNNFSSLALNSALMQAVSALGFTEMTEIQAASLPHMLAGNDIIAQSKTGSGKTAAFGLALLSKLDVKNTSVQALVICPTRELADQVSSDIRKLASFTPNVKLLTLCGGVSIRPQLASLTHAPHIVVGTPGRIKDLLQRHVLDVSTVTVLVLDEADRMLDMGFEESINSIIKKTPNTRQTLMFSATFPDEIRAISKKYLKKPITVTVGTSHSEEVIEQWFYEVESSGKPEALARLLIEYGAESTIVFCNTKIDTQRVADSLYASGFSVLALHGDLEQRDRDQTLVQFANKSCSVLVATDVAARGLDIKELPLVISYELPTDPEIHVHRIGRTGRAGQKGIAISLVSHSEARRIKQIEEKYGLIVRFAKLPAGKKSLTPTPAAMQTLVVYGGRQDKVRPGDIVGALTGDAGLSADSVGKIDIFTNRAYVAISRKQAAIAMKRLDAGKIKGRKFRVQKLSYHPVTANTATYRPKQHETK